MTHVPGASPELIHAVVHDVVAQLTPVLSARVDAAVAAAGIGAHAGGGGVFGGGGSAAALALSAPPACPSCRVCETRQLAPLPKACPSCDVQPEDMDCPPQRECPPLRVCSDSSDNGGGGAIAIVEEDVGVGGEMNVTALQARIVYLETKLAKKDQKIQSKEEDIKILRIENDNEVHKCMKREVYERKLRQRLEGRVMGVMVGAVHA